MDDLNNINLKANKALKWSAITELSSKMIAPLIYMLLARIMSPSDFGYISMIIMLISFSEIFADVGFHKYLIQNDFSCDKEKNDTVNVAFWTSLGFSFIILAIIFVFRGLWAAILGLPDLVDAIPIACLQIPFIGISGILTAFLKRKFDFKGLFYINLFTIITPVIIATPMALLGFGVWSIIIADIAKNIIRMLLAFRLTGFKPKLNYSMYTVKNAYRFSFWATLDSVAVWFTAYIDAILIAHIYSAYYLGIYRGSINLVGGVMSIPFAAMAPILASGLARLQFDDVGFKKFVLSYHNKLAYLLLPIAVTIYVYKDIVVHIMFGNKWIEAAPVVGITAISIAMRMIFVSVFSAVYIAKGKPRVCFLLQVMDLLVIVIGCFWGRYCTFWDFVVIRAIVRMDLIVPGLYLLKKIAAIGPRELFDNTYKPISATIIYGIVLSLGSVMPNYDAIRAIIGVIGCIIYVLLFSYFENDNYSLASSIYKYIYDKE